MSLSLRRSALGRAFGRAHRQQGRPSLTVVGAISIWTLPAGYAYDPSTDCIRHTNGTVLTSYAAYQVTTAVSYLPARLTETSLALIASGLLKPGALEIFVQPADVSALEGAWRVQVGGVEYRLQRLERATSDGWARAVLERAKT